MSDPLRHPRYRALRNLFLTLWDKAVRQPSYERGEWEEVQAGIDLIAGDGLGEEAALDTEEPTPTLTWPWVLEGSRDGAAWVVLARLSSAGEPVPLRNHVVYSHVRVRRAMKGDTP